MSKSARFPGVTHLLLTSVALGFSLTGCGGGGGETGGTGGATVPPQKLDGAPVTPPVGGAGGADAMVTADDTSGAGGNPTGGAGGTRGPEAGPPDTRLVPETAADRPLEVLPPPDLQPETFTEAGASGGALGCRGPKSAHSYDPTVLGSIAPGEDGKVLTAARIFGSTPFDFGGKQLVSNGSADMLVAKLDPKTGEALWTLAAGDAVDQAATGIAPTSAGIGVAGKFKGTLDITNGAGSIAPISNPSNGYYAFLAGVKSADGSPLWLKSVNLGATGVINQVASQYSKDYFLVCGSAINNAAALSATGTVGNGANVLIAAVKASDGSVLWAKLFGGDRDQDCTTATLDDSGNALFAGTYTGTLDFGAGALDPAPTDPTNPQIRSLWVAKFNGTTGALVTAKGFTTNKRITPNQIVTNAQGEVVVVGMFSGVITFGSTTLTPTTGGNGFAVKLAADSLSPTWARRWGGQNASDYANPSGAAFDSAGTLTVVGAFTGSIDIGGPTANPATVDGGVAGSIPGTNPGGDIFIATLNGSTGETLCAKGYGDLAGESAATTIVIDRWATGAGKDAVAISGVYRKVLNFGPPTTALSSVAVVGYLLQM